MKLRRAAAAATAFFLPAFVSCSEDKPASAPVTASAGASGVGIAGAAGTAAAGVAGRTAGAAGMNTAGAAGMNAAGAAGMNTAGAAGTTSGNSVAATFDTVKLVFGGGGGIMTCSAAPCHGVNGMAPPSRPLELPTNDDAKLYANLTSYVSAACSNTKLVTPGNPAQSALITILKGPCGATPRMPFGCSAEAGDCIPDEYIAAVTQWIANGAKK
jgi:hypothetical protein